MTGIGEFAVALLDDVTKAIEECGQGPACRNELVTGGDVAWQVCSPCSDDSCGMAYVRIGEGFTFSSFPEPDVSPTCIHQEATVLAVGVVRCWPLGDDEEGPSEEAVANATLGLMEDRAALRSAILAQMSPHIQLSIANWVGRRPARRVHLR